MNLGRRVEDYLIATPEKCAASSGHSSTIRCCDTGLSEVLHFDLNFEQADTGLHHNRTHRCCLIPPFWIQCAVHLSLHRCGLGEAQAQRVGGGVLVACPP